MSSLSAAAPSRCLGDAFLLSYDDSRLLLNPPPLSPIVKLPTDYLPFAGFLVALVVTARSGDRFEPVGMRNVRSLLLLNVTLAAASELRGRACLPPGTSQFCSLLSLLDSSSGFWRGADPTSTPNVVYGF